MDIEFYNHMIHLNTLPEGFISHYALPIADASQDKDSVPSVFLGMGRSI
jgi:hypothetical protein